ncbi:Uncharacterised protein [Chlamydia abortus]|nr:Uncharacterised protein [Chlamydia abortus]
MSLPKLETIETFLSVISASEEIKTGSLLVSLLIRISINILINHSGLVPVPNLLINKYSTSISKEFTSAITS